MDETSGETSTSESTTNDTDNKSKTDTGNQKTSKEISVGLSEKNTDQGTKSDVEANEEKKPPECDKSHPSNGEDNKVEVTVPQTQNSKSESDNNEINTNKEPLANEADEKCQAQSPQIEIEKETKEESVVSSEKEIKVIQNRTKPESPPENTSHLTKDKSNGQVAKENISDDDSDKKGDDKDADTNVPPSSENNVTKINDNNDKSQEENKRNISREDDKCSPSTSTISTQKEDVSKAKIVDKGNEEDQSKNASRKEVENASLNSKVHEKSAHPYDDTALETKDKNDPNVKSNPNKCNEKGKPPQTSCESECQNQLNARGKPKRASDTNNACEGSSATGTRQPAAETHPSSLPNNPSKLPSAAASKLNTLEILTAKHLNDGSKFEIFKGLIEVGKMTNKEVVNAVLYLVRKYF